MTQKGNEDNKILEKLDFISRLLILQIRGNSTDTDMVTRLVKARFKPAEIAKLLGIPTKDVTSRISQKKKQTNSNFSFR